MDVNMLLLFADDDDVIIQEDSSSSSEDDEELIELFDFVVQKIKKARVTTKNFCEEVVSVYSDEDFQKHFRLKRTLVQDLIRMFENAPEYQRLLTTHSRVSITPTKHMLVFLWFAGHQTASFRDVADRFDLALSSLHDVITRVISFVISLQSKYIQFPSAEDKARTKTHYRLKYGLPNVIASIDASHIKIDAPGERHKEYFNKKRFYSVILQAACDEECRFLDVSIGCPGSVDDAQVFRNSMLYKNLDKLCRNGEYILGDSAYPLLPNLMTPYWNNEHLTGTQKHFNQTLDTCRASIEHAVGLLKRRFRQLYRVKLKGISRICNFITACCVLHNLTIGDNLTFDDEEYNDNQPKTVPLKVAKADELTKQGNKLRNELSEVLFLRKKQVIG